MTSERLRRIIRSRWWVLALAGLFSVLAAVLVTQSRNDAIPEHEAVVAVTFNRLLGEVDDTLAQERLNTAEQIATVVNSSDLATNIDPLTPGVRAEVIATESDLRLLFIGRGATREEASSVATTMRDRYLAVQQLDISQEFAQRIADTAARLDQVLVAIAIATPPPDVGGIETTARMLELQAEVVAFATLYGQYTAELIEPRNPPRGQATILADRDAASEALRAAQDELSSLEFAVGGTTVHDIDLALLVAEEAQLRAALDAYMAQSISDEPIAVVGPVELRESEIPPTPLPVAIVVGLLVGLLIGIAGLVIVDRVRQPLWEPTELDPRYRLPEVAARPRSLGDSAKPWYETAPYSRRKAGIQELRSAVEGLPGFGDGVVVGVASLTGPSSHVHELAADLAAGLASSGSWALLIDADYGQPSDLPEYRRHDFELEDVMADPQGTLGEAADSADRTRDFLGVAISKRSADAADLLAQPAFAHMLDAAQAMHDAVIVACPPTESASYHVLSQRLDAMILVATAGDSIPADVVNVLRTLEERRSVPAGVVLIRPRIGPISLIMNQLERPLPTPDPAPAQEFEWQWSEGKDVKSGSDVISVASQEPGPPAEGIGSEGFDTAAAPAPTPSGVGATTLATGPSREQDNFADQPETGDGEPATRTERIKRRAFPKRNVDKAPANDRGADRSAWSYRDGSE
jgi:Mrp family chromosome partitioning ATPase